MNAIFVAIVALGSFYMAYRFYGRFLSKKIFNLGPDLRTPARELEDGRDIVGHDMEHNQVLQKPGLASGDCCLNHICTSFMACW